jgi:adenylate cyclase
MSQGVLRDRLVAVLAADAVGYSRLMSVDERGTIAALDAARAVFRAEIATHGGRVVDMAGDSVMSVFESAAGAMQAALAVQRQLHLAKDGVPSERQLCFRIGVHVGDVVEKADGTIYGDGVNIAARLEGLAEPGAVAISQSVHGMVARRVDAVYDDIGEQVVKNIAQPVRVFRVRLSETRALPGAPAEDRLSPSAGAAAAAPPPIASLSPPDVLFGRDELLQRLCQQMGRAETRLLTLTGPGGSGKTRLALRAAEQLAPTMVDGARVVLLLRRCTKRTT